MVSGSLALLYSFAELKLNVYHSKKKKKKLKKKKKRKKKKKNKKKSERLIFRRLLLIPLLRTLHMNLILIQPYP